MLQLIELVQLGTLWLAVRLFNVMPNSVVAVMSAPSIHSPTVESPYVEKTGDSFRVVGSRVSIDSIVHAYWNGQTAESIAQSFPDLKLEQVHGALAFYLAHQAEIDAYLRLSQTEYDQLREESRRQDPMFYQKLAKVSARQS